MTPAGIEPATFRFVAQHLNRCATAVPRWVRVTSDIYGAQISFTCIYICLSVRLFASNEISFVKFDIFFFFRKYVDKIQVSLKSDKNKGARYVKKALSQNCGKRLLGSSSASVRMEKLAFPLDGFFMKFGISILFRKSIEKIHLSLQPHNNNVTLHADRYTCLIISRAVLLTMRNVSDKSCRANHNTHFVFSNFFHRKSCRLWDNVGKYCRAWQPTDDNMAHALCMLDN